MWPAACAGHGFGVDAEAAVGDGVAHGLDAVGVKVGVGARLTIQGACRGRQGHGRTGGTLGQTFGRFFGGNRGCGFKGLLGSRGGLRQLWLVGLSS